MNVDVLVIGGGTAGCAAARSARKRGLSVALVESTRLGGECLWWTCLPTKALVVAADVYQTVRDGVAFGVDTDGYHLNYDTVRARKDALVAEFAQRTDADALNREGITVLHGRAAFNEPHEVVVREDTVHAEHIVLAVGAHPSMPPIPGLDTIKPLTYMRAMSLTKVPTTLAIIGGGAVGCEFAQLFRRFGAEVNLIECGPRLLPGEDVASSDAAKKLLTTEGITVTTAATVTQAAMDNGQRVITMEHQGATVRIRADEVL
ncbi:MAG TPA: FAD-dependent oxidoreductase, partial [Armatimonadota bacterium]|nr:FAD-dependent oxidoreductase [Armatimonadota bacterium]